MTQKKYNKTNFHNYTFCEFTEVNADKITNIDRHYKSKSGSSYYFTEEGVYRCSNHWGRAANCRWRLISEIKNPNQKARIGYAKWTDFYPNNETEALFYIEVNFETLVVTFQHKNHSNYDGIAIVRTAAETAKVIRQIKEVLETDAWAKYYDTTSIDSLRRDIIHQLCFSTLSLLEIKRNLLGHSHGK